MKISLSFIACTLFAYLLSAQPTIQWQKSLGGSQYDGASSIQQTTDGGYIVIGTTQSNDGNVLNFKGLADIWVVKLNSDGQILWQKTLGGSNIEVGHSIQQTKDGGYIVAGFTLSNDGDVSGNKGLVDCWVVKLNNTGVIQWQKTFGGSKEDRTHFIQQTQEGGYILAGYTNSSDWDVSSNHGLTDFWVVKLTTTGIIEWEKALGGTGVDEAYSITQTTDGGFLVTGTTRSNNGDVSGNNGNQDFWTVKLTNSGTIEWQKALGGSGADDGRLGYQTNDGGYLIAGTQGSGDGQISESQGKTDYWVVKLNHTGDILWEKSLGGSDEDGLNAMQATNDGGCILAGFTQSKDGDVMNNDVIADIWVVSLDSVGGIKWSKTFGGTEAEFAGNIQKTMDGGYVIAGSAESNDGDVSGNHGSSDFWIVKLSPESSLTTTPTALPLDIYPNPATHTISLQAPRDHATGAGETPLSIRITDLLGQEISQQILLPGKALDIAALPNGMYILTAIDALGKVFSGRFMKQE